MATTTTKKSRKSPRKITLVGTDTTKSKVCKSKVKKETGGSNCKKAKVCKTKKAAEPEVYCYTRAGRGVSLPTRFGIDDFVQLTPRKKSRKSSGKKA